jgi:alpha/beta superfamily hydrolase
MEKIMVQGKAGSLQGALHMAKLSTDDFLIICHPHPLFGGTMDNKVVTTAAKTYLDAGINVIRFNYRGVGESTGQYGNMIGEVEDARAIFDWVKGKYPLGRLFLAGFSFGCFIAAKLARDLSKSGVTIPHLLMIAPSVEHSPFEEAVPLAAECTVIMGEQDEVVPFELVRSWVSAQEPSIEFIVQPEASHFFHRQLIVMRTHIKEVVSRYLSDKRGVVK